MTAAAVDLDRIGTPPGAQARPSELVAKMAAALRHRGPGYVPRTHHRRSDGAPTYTNRLILEASPYLLQHAHNPVDWYAWGEEAFNRARREGRPVFLSVGYSTCHWCHVMEVESFEDEEIARSMNERYVCIKVDREERPDVDAVYMAAVQALTGGGGWPMSVWLTPEKKPFFGGTYFPPRDGARGARSGFLTIVREIARAYEMDRPGVTRQADRLADHVREAVGHPAPPAGAGAGALGAGPLHRASRDLLGQFDPVWGGFGGAPKFPRSVAIEFLLRYARRTGAEVARSAAVTTLDRMARGGLYDQVGGGFHRYATDGEWLVPHFEKMLYDNALLAVSYVEGWQATGRDDFRRIARETLDYLAREMRSPDGAFYAATDADSEGEEGRFFVWDAAEIDRALVPALGAERGRAVGTYWGVTPAGNFEGRNILWVPRPAPEAALAMNVDPGALLADVARAREVLYALRATRVPPSRDDKVLAGWNGLALSAFARAGFAFGADGAPYVEIARHAADFVLSRMVKDGRLARTWQDGAPRHAAVLEDYAFVVAGLLDVFEATGDARLLRGALDLQRVVDSDFTDPAGGYFATARGAEALLAREKPDYDGAVPSGNSVAIQNSLRLAEITGEESHRGNAERALRAFSTLLDRAPTAAPRLLSALDFYLDQPPAVVIVVPAPAGAGPIDSVGLMQAAEPFLARLRGSFQPNHVRIVAAESSLGDLARLAPIVEDKVARDGRPTAYVCHGRTCDLPATDPETFARQLARVVPLPPS